MGCGRIPGFLMAVAVFLASTAAFSQEPAVTVTAYNQDRALVHEVRKIHVPRGVQTLEYKDVAETIQPSSIQVRSLTSPAAFKILDQTYEHDLINVPNLLNKYIGRELKVVLPDPAGAQGALMMREARLLSNNEKPIFLLDASGKGTSSEGKKEIYLGDTHGILLPEIPPGLRPRPTLVWLVDNRGEEEQQIEVSYLAGKINWHADYVLNLDRDGIKGSLTGWVTLYNHCGKAFEKANLRLVAGDIRMERPREPVFMKAPAEDTARAAEAVQEEELFEYHLYSVERPVDIGHGQSRQICLLRSPEVRLAKRLTARWQNSFFAPPSRAIRKQKVGVFLKFKNSVENGLGIPLPRGVVRAYQAGSDGFPVFIGEDHTDHVGRDVEAELAMGEAFDVILERRQTVFRKTGANTHRLGWEIRIKNSKEVPQRVYLEETMPGDWRLIDAGMVYEKPDARTIRFTVDALPSGKKKDTVVTYEVEVSG